MFCARACVSGTPDDSARQFHVRACPVGRVLAWVQPGILDEMVCNIVSVLTPQSRPARGLGLADRYMVQTRQCGSLLISRVLCGCSNSEGL